MRIFNVVTLKSSPQDSFSRRFCLVHPNSFFVVEDLSLQIRHFYSVVINNPNSSYRWNMTYVSTGNVRKETPYLRQQLQGTGGQDNQFLLLQQRQQKPFVI